MPTTYMFQLRNKKIIFLLHTLSQRPGTDLGDDPEMAEKLWTGM